MRNLTILTIALCCIVYSCDKFGNNNYTVSGKVQKGPFSKGSDVTLYELEDDLQQTGKSFLSSISADDGSYEFNNIGIHGDLALIDAEGFYFNELFGELSPAQISLHAIADLSDEQAVNVNVMTHVIRDRIEYLVADGKSFIEAKTQAESELLIFLGAAETTGDDFESLDISLDSEQNAILLSFSIMLQRYIHNTNNDRQQLPAELIALLSTMSEDFRDDGMFEKSIIDTLLHNISVIVFDEVRDKVELRYEALGVNTTIPDFEKHLVAFQKKYNNNIYTSFYYPEESTVDPLIDPDIEIPNLLYPQLTNYQAIPYSMAAIIPFDASLTIEFIIDPGSSEYPFAFGMFNSGWEIENNYPNGFTLHSQKNNELMTLLFHLENYGSATMEYYENDSDTPTLSKDISWGVADY